jgi:hypothetical protein
LANAGEPAPDSGVVVLVDQFEEIFTRCADPQARERFAEKLLALARGVPLYVVIVTLRMDFYEKCAPHKQLAEALADHQIVLGPLDAEGLQAAIERPARKAHWNVEPALTATLIATNPPLPLLQAVMKQLWKKGREQRRMTIADFRPITFERAINTLAEEFFQPLTAEDQETTLSLLSKLAQPNGEGDFVRKRLPLNELIPADPGQAKKVEWLIGKLSGPDLRLLTIRFERGRALADVAHEAIFKAWTPLASRLAADADFLDWRQRLEADIRPWQRSEDRRYCITGGRLKEALNRLRQRARDLTESERKYIYACKRHRDRMRAAKIAVAALALSAASVSAVVFNSRAELKSLKAAARAETGRRNPLGIALAYHAARRDASPETEVLLQDAVQVFSSPLLEGVSSFKDVAIDSAGKTVMIASVENAILVWRAETWGSNLGAVTELKLPEPATRIASNPDGSLVAAGGLEARVFDTATGNQAYPAVRPGGALTAIAIAPDGKSLAVASADRQIQWRGKIDGSLSAPSIATDLAFRPDGSALAAAFEDATFRVYDLARGAESETGRLRGVANYVAFSSDGMLLAAGGQLADARVWNLRSGDRRTFELAGGSVRSTAFSADGGRLAAVTDDWSIMLWDARSGSELARHHPPERTTKIVISADGRRLVGLVESREGSPGAARVYELDRAALLRRALEVVADNAHRIDCNGYASARSACDKIKAEAQGK